MNILKEWMYFLWSCLNQLDHYEYIKAIDDFHSLWLKPMNILNEWIYFPR